VTTFTQIIKAITQIGLGVAILFIAIYFINRSFIRGNQYWVVAFEAKNGSRQISISRSNSSILVNILFTKIKSDQFKGSKKIIFSSSKNNELPFGRLKTFDLTTFPGYIVLEIYGHEIKILERALIIDKHEYYWESNSGKTLKLDVPHVTV